MGMSARILRNEIYGSDLQIGYYRLFFETSGYFILSIIPSKSADDKVTCSDNSAAVFHLKAVTYLIH